MTLSRGSSARSGPARGRLHGVLAGRPDAAVVPRGRESADQCAVSGGRVGLDRIPDQIGLEESHLVTVLAEG